MKILKLNLIAFGPFSDTVLNFGQGNSGLHIVYGANEAGKSSALRSLKQSLYGIPDRSADDFVHPYPKLRIGAVISNSSGKVLEFIRRKGRSNTLRASDDVKVIDDADLLNFLSGADENLFSTMFGIDHAALVRGGEEIIRGGGHIGQILFAAGSGISDFRKVQSALQAEADDLFKSGGKNPKINKTLSELKDIQKALRDTQLSEGQWVQHDEALQEALRKKTVIEKELSEKSRQRNCLERIRDALPYIGKRRELLTEYESYENAVLLSENFSERRRETITNFKIAENDAALSEKNLEAIRQSLNELHFAENLLENSDLIEIFHKKSGEYLKDILDRPRLIGLLSSAYTQGRAILSGIRNDLAIEEAAEKLKLKKADFIKIQELGALYEKLTGQRETIRTETSRLSVKTEQIKAQLFEITEPPDISEFQKLLDHIRQQGDMEAQYEAQCSEIEKAEYNAKIALKKLHLWKGDLESLEKLPVPLAENIDVFEDRLKKAEDFFTKRHSELEAIVQKLADIQNQIERLRLEQEVPTEADLLEARQMRDLIWQQIRNSDFSSEIMSSYEIALHNADDLSDRLRREADRVTRKATLLADQEIHKTQQARLTTHLEKAEAAFSKLKEEWLELWKESDIIPNSPREMRAWLQKHAALVNQAVALRDQKAKAELLKQKIEAYCQKLSSKFESLGLESGDTLSVMLETGYRFVRQAEKIRSRREQLLAESESRENELKDAVIRADRIDTELKQCQERWAVALLPLGLDAQASLAQASGVISDLKDLFSKLEEIKVFEKRIKGIDRDTLEISEKVKDFVKREVPELLKLPTEQIVTELNARLNRAREAKARWQYLEKQSQQEEKSLKTARHNIAQIQVQIKALCEEAGCQSPEALPEAEIRSSKRREIQKQIRQSEETLHKLSGGATLEIFVQDASEHDPDSLEPQIIRLSEEIEEFNKQKSMLDQTIGQEKSELSRMDGSAKAAQLAEDVQGLLAKIQSNAQHYVRLKLSSAVLSRAIERYREKHQGPILKRSAELFSRITLSAYEGLRPEFDDKGEAVLVGVRSLGREIVRTEQMSEGTADQLYLAVRLASLEAFLEKNEPLPFIADDILIKFDDARAVATLQVLAQLSEKTQVIFFTHHQHLVELAQKHLDESVLFTLSLR